MGSAPGGTRGRGTLPLWIVIGALLALDVLLCAKVVPVPVTDETFYKGPAWELAFRGRLALPMAKGYTPGIENGFPYPPLFSIVLAAWYRAVGFGGPQDLAFTLLWHLLVAAFAGALAFRLAGRANAIWAPVASVATYTYMRLDRPDHLAQALALCSALLLVAGAERDRRRLALAAGLAAAALSVGPAAALIYATFLLVLAFAVLPTREVAFAAAIAVGLLAAGAAAFALGSPKAFAGLVATCVGVLREALGFRAPRITYVNWWFPWFALFLVCSLRLLWRGEADRRLRGLTLGTLAGLLAWSVLTKRNGSYLMLLYPFAVVTCVAAVSRVARPAAAAAGVAAWLAAGAAIPGLNVARALAMTSEDSFGFARRLVRDVIPRGSVVVGDGGTFTLLNGNYEFYDLAWGGRQLDRAEYVVSTAVGTGELSKTSFDRFPAERRAAFKVVADSLVPEPQRLFGVALGRTRMGYGLRIYRRWETAAAPASGR